uniref:Uncharacterized protein n=1 Tax=Anguilla anguilla TaxID=7936 RepID=A0A0E9Q1Q0_ANGAN
MITATVFLFIYFFGT